MNFKFKLLSTLLYFSVLTCFGPKASSRAEVKMKTVSVSQIIQHPALDTTYKGLIEGLKRRGYIQGKNLNLNYEQAQGNLAIASQISQKFASQNPDVLVGVATGSAQSLVNASQGIIPVVFSSVTDPIGANLVKNLDGNPFPVTGVSNLTSMKEQLQFMKNVLPKLKRLGLIYNPSEFNSTQLAKTIKDIAPEAGITVEESPANKTIEVPTATRFLMGKVDAILITNDNTALSAFDAVTQISLQQKVPVFTSDVDIVSQGALAALGPDQFEIGCQTGGLVADILEGKDARKIPVGFPKSTSIYLNQSVASSLGLSFDAELIKQADKIL